MLILIKEVGSALTNSNSYASAADGDAYHLGHIYASAWNSATLATKEAALVMASRAIDSVYQFNGFKSSNGQAMQWPRRFCPDPDRLDRLTPGLAWFRGPYVDYGAVPVPVLNAAIEFARELIKADSTDAPDGQGIGVLKVSRDLEMTFDKKDVQPFVPRFVQLMLGRFGSYLDASGVAAKLLRV